MRSPIILAAETTLLSGVGPLTQSTFKKRSGVAAAVAQPLSDHSPIAIPAPYRHHFRDSSPRH